MLRKIRKDDRFQGIVLKSSAERCIKCFPATLMLRYSRKSPAHCSVTLPKLPPSHVAHQELLIAAKEQGEYF